MTRRPAHSISRPKALAAIRSAHENGVSGVRVGLLLTRLHDAILTNIFRRLDADGANDFAVVALGGYGRGELCFGSDIDVMILARDDDARTRATPAITSFLHALLNAGSDIGHTVRTIDQCVRLRNEDFASWTALLESRFICGNASVFRRFHTALAATIRTDDHAALVAEILRLSSARRLKYGSSSKLLEPNVKNSAGGLRDLHTILWLLRGTGLAPLTPAGPLRSTATLSVLGVPAVRSLLTPTQRSDVQQAAGVLQRVRCEMHLHAGGLQDMLSFSLQPHIAGGLRYRQRTNRSKVEHFMQDYYVAARTVSGFATRILAWAQDHWTDQPALPNAGPIDTHLEQRGGRIHLRGRSSRLTSELLLRAFRARQRTGLPFSFALEDRIHRSLRNVRPLRSGPESTIWNDILSAPGGVADTIRAMNGMGLLERWIPEWRPLVAFFQHNQYHFYTADEHTLLVLASAEQLASADTPFGEAFRRLPRTDVLAWACLLHDIAKPVNVVQHEILGVAVVRRILKRIDASAIAEDVAFLVRHHLMMEQMAFRRNLSDPQTIAEFAHHFRDVHQLDALFALTYADLSAVNRNVFTEWKATLLTELYRKSREVLAARLSDEELHDRSAREKEAAKRTLVRALADEFPSKLIANHVELTEDPSYFISFGPAEIREHLRTIMRRPAVHALFSGGPDVTDVTIIALDAPYALSRFCGVLSANDANILDANIFTRRDGIIIDRFRVVDVVSRSALDARQQERILRELDDVFHDRTDLRDLLTRHRMKWKRRALPPNPNIRLDVEFEDHPRSTIIDIYAADTLGFLYRITECLSRMGLDIASAKIATRVDGIVDSFYVTEDGGGKITGRERMEEIRAELLRAIHETAENELVLGD